MTIDEMIKALCAYRAILPGDTKVTIFNDPIIGICPFKFPTSQGVRLRFKGTKDCTSELDELIWSLINCSWGPSISMKDQVYIALETGSVPIKVITKEIKKR